MWMLWSRIRQLNGDLVRFDFSVSFLSVTMAARRRLAHGLDALGADVLATQHSTHE